ncbi:hypothetical protein C8F04DRAFT_1151554 [Mycena alexandri]|uniref:Uncharacterized protein n=1 Tax=Mycena alexandri TaxID=1745969 RepID=A0AAD6S0X4_9AGAR|nr:hypothetical protein C8F04DRAFT_1151554 [Mycena alexandri]
MWVIIQRWAAFSLCLLSVFMANITADSQTQVHEHVYLATPTGTTLFKSAALSDLLRDLSSHVELEFRRNLSLGLTLKYYSRYVLSSDCNLSSGSHLKF